MSLRKKASRSKGRGGATTLFVNAAQVVTCRGNSTARRGAAMGQVDVLMNSAVAVQAGRVVGIGTERELLKTHRGARKIDCKAGVLMPALVDSHTHAVFGAPRYAEHEMRAAGKDYMEIAKQGGGIHFSVRDLRDRSERELLSLTRRRLMTLASFGVGTIEVKSGYGLSLEAELKMLRVIARLSADLPMRLIPTFLGAHEIPQEYRATEGKRREYVELLINEMIPLVAKKKLAVFADVFCERGVYTVEESRQILSAAKTHGLKLKLHADELTSFGGAQLAAEIGATSADHLAAIADDGIAALSRAGTVATLLPATMTFLGKAKQAPARQLIEAGVPVALATDFNPGTSPTVSLPLALTLGVSQLRLSAAEAIVAATVNGAAALDLAKEAGQIAPGFSADLALFEMSDYRELPYWVGARLCRGLWMRGKACDLYDLDVT